MPTEMPNDSLIHCADSLTIGFNNALSANCNVFAVNLQLDFYRSIFGDVKVAYVSKADLIQRMPLLPRDFFFVLIKHDQGRQAVFPVAVKPRLSFTRAKMTVLDGNRNIVAKRPFPIEKWVVEMRIAPCAASDIDIELA